MNNQCSVCHQHHSFKLFCHHNYSPFCAKQLLDTVRAGLQVYRPQPERPNFLGAAIMKDVPAITKLRMAKTKAYR